MKNLLVLSLLFLLTSCGKENLPVILIDSPADLQEVSIGDSILFNGSIIYDQDIGGFGFELSRINVLQSSRYIQTIEMDNSLIFRGSLLVTEETFSDKPILFSVSAANSEGESVREERNILLKNE